MSEHPIYIIPQKINYMPPAAQQHNLDDFFLELGVSKKNDIQHHLYDSIQIILAGESFAEPASFCPTCRSNIGEWWFKQMDSAYDKEQHGFNEKKLSETRITPCCSTEVTLLSVLPIPLFDEDDADNEEITKLENSCLRTAAFGCYYLELKTAGANVINDTINSDDIYKKCKDILGVPVWVIDAHW